jgi:2-amino-4-hydroxy-6-hydroxymethyldihydropteridine diphosphokinase
MAIAYLSLGSNLGDREVQLREALRHLAAIGQVLAVSSFYETEPVDLTEQPWFLNCAVVLETGNSAQELMASLLEIERQMGRQRMQRKGPRSIDMDILLLDDYVISSQKLTIPHPAMHKRRFVLEALAEIAPDLIHPILKKTIRQLQDALPPGQKVKKLQTNGS